MGEIDTRRLIVVLEDLQGELVRWSAVSRDTLVSATYRQRLAEEQATRAIRDAAIVQSNVEDDRATVTRIDTAVVHIESLGLEAATLAQQTLKEARRWLKEAEQTKQRWEAELSLALAWLARAEERVRLAEIELVAAQNALSAARSELQSAQWALQSCQNYRDDKGRRRNCSGEAGRVSRAQVVVALAMERVRLAEIELLDARAELARAQARVTCCRQAVALSSQAVETALEARAQSIIAVNMAERSRESGASARHWVIKSTETVTQEKEILEDLQRDLNRIQVVVDETNRVHGQASRTEETAQRYLSLVGRELDNRILHLRYANRPALADS